MGLFEVDLEGKKTIKIPEAEFSTKNVYERRDIQEWVEKSPDMLGEDLLIIAKEFHSFDKTSERPDLVALDENGNIVIIELKRDFSGYDTHWQAIKYASYFRKVNYESIAEIYSKNVDCDLEEAKNSISKFLGKNFECEGINKKQRIILASHRFASEVTSAVIWLNENGLDISCVEIMPFSLDGKMIIQTNKIIPVLGSDRLEINVSVGGQTVVLSKKENTNINDETTNRMRAIHAKLSNLLSESGLSLSQTSRWAGIYGQTRYFKMWFNSSKWHNHCCSFQLHAHLSESDERFISARFCLQKEWGSKVDINENQIESLLKKLQELRENEDEIINDEYTIGLVRFFHKDELTNNENIVAFLKKLVESVYTTIEKT